jgi:hypothetical protein
MRYPFINQHFIPRLSVTKEQTQRITLRHIFGAAMRGEIDNNIMERVNNTIRATEKNYGGLNTEVTPMIPLFVAYYNLVREHQALGKTPAKAAVIDLKLRKDKWIGLIKKANKNPDGKVRVWENQ